MRPSLLLATTRAAFAANPLVPHSGMADTNIHYFNGTFLAFATHDFDENNTGFLMRDWQTWTSSDLVNWELASTVNPSISFPTWGQDQRDECWATDAALVEDRYYFYVSVGGAEIGVLTSYSPHGPWEDALGAPLLSSAQGKALDPQTTFRDPAVFKDDDGEHYLIAGVFNYYIAKLSSNMTAFAEPLRHVDVQDPYGPCGDHTTDDKPFIHKYNGTYYLSWGCFYATSSSIYGPYVTQGSVIDRASIDADFRMPVDPSKAWYRQEDYEDRHGSFLERRGQWFFASNDRSHSGDVQPGYYRNTVMCYVHFRANGTMAPCRIDGTGVGQYNASRAIQAEDFFEAAGAKKLDLRALGVDLAAGDDGDFAVAAGVHIADDNNQQSYLVYPHVRGVRGGEIVKLRVRAANGDDVAFKLSWEVTDGKGSGATGLCAIESTGSWTEFAEFDCELAKEGAELPDVDDLQLKLLFAGRLLHVDSLELVTSTATATLV